jgi:hypothetical protein
VVDTGPTERIAEILQEGPPPEPEYPPEPGAPCCVPECLADSRRGTLQGGAPMFCGGKGMVNEPCIAVWLMDDTPATFADYRAFVRACRE